jgi:hypothetical protein
MRTEVQLSDANDAQNAVNRAIQNLVQLTRGHYERKHQIALGNQTQQYQTLVDQIQSTYQGQLAQHEKQMADIMFNYGKQCGTSGGNRLSEI